jgi:hypothetical protein
MRKYNCYSEAKRVFVESGMNTSGFGNLGYGVEVDKASELIKSMKGN